MLSAFCRSPQPRPQDVKAEIKPNSDEKCASPTSTPETQPALHVRVWSRLCAICETIHNILRIIWLMLVIMYRYPNASRGAAMISYRALLLSYQYQLWSLSGLCGYGAPTTSAKQQEAQKATPKPVEEVRKEAEASLRGELPKEKEEASTKTASANSPLKKKKE